MVESLKQDDYHVSVGIIGKYVELEDAYMSIRESLKPTANLGIKVDIEWIQAENTIDEDKVSHLDSLLIPGGFGERGISGKLDAVRIPSRMMFLYLEFVWECSAWSLNSPA